MTEIVWNEFQIEDNASYFISQVHKVMDRSYLPTDQDILQTRERTIGPIEHIGNKTTLVSENECYNRL